MGSSVSVIIPAYNEEPNIQAALDGVQRVLKEVADDYEILVVNDGSTDRTGALLSAIAAGHHRIRVITHKVNRGYGAAFQTGIRAAGKEYLTMFPGDNENTTESLRNVIQYRGQADLIICYPSGGYKRSFFRRFISKAYVIALNVLFGLKLRYYNGIFILKTDLARDVMVRSTGFSAVSECVIKLLKQGHSCREYPFRCNDRPAGRSKAIGWKNLLNVAVAVAVLVWDVYRPFQKETKGKT